MGMKGIALSVATVLLVAGCAGKSAGSPSAAGRLVVHIGMFGGPANPNGQMALSNAPAVGKLITATNSAGRQWQARTDARGRATFDVPAGRYTVVSSYCGRGPQHVHLRPNATARVQIQCDVP
jgi:hypothetical protein